MIPRGLKRYDCPQNTVIGVKKLSFQDEIGIFKCDSRKSEWDVSSLDASILLLVIFIGSTLNAVIYFMKLVTPECHLRHLHGRYPEVGVLKCICLLGRYSETLQFICSVRKFLLSRGSGACIDPEEFSGWMWFLFNENLAPRP